MTERAFWAVALFWALPECVVCDGWYERGQETVPFFVLFVGATDIVQVQGCCLAGYSFDFYACGRKS